MQKIILASGSPRRFDLLSGYGYDVTVVRPDFDESNVSQTSPELLVCELARGKNECVRDIFKGEIILSADTIVCLENKVLGKPKDREDAKRMLSELSDNTHTVYTGVCIYKDGKEIVFAERSDVTFYKLTDERIEQYIDTGSPFDKAGSYGLQDDIGITFIKKVDGEISNVIGLPMGRVIEQIQKIGGSNK